MGDKTFYDWLIDVKKYTHFAAKDTISRCNRIKRIINSDELNGDSVMLLNSNEEFCHYSKFVKSQLRRSLALFVEYQEAK